MDAPPSEPVARGEYIAALLAQGRLTQTGPTTFLPTSTVRMWEKMGIALPSEPANPVLKLPESLEAEEWAVHLHARPQPNTSGEGGGRRGFNVVLVGTVHVLHESSELARHAVEVMQPRVTLVELDWTRAAMATATEEQLEDATSVPRIAAQYLAGDLDFTHAVLSIFYSRITKKLELGLPGSEFRKAYQQSMAQQAKVVLMDRSVNVTIARAIDRLSLWERIWGVFLLVAALIWSLVGSAASAQESLDDVSSLAYDRQRPSGTRAARRQERRRRAEERAPERSWGDKILHMLGLGIIEEMDHADIHSLEDVIDLAGDTFPSVADVLLHERDRIMAHAIASWASLTYPYPAVAVLGRAHVPGVLEILESETESPVLPGDEVRGLMAAPEPSLWTQAQSWLMFTVSIAVVYYLLGLYTALFVGLWRLLAWQGMVGRAIDAVLRHPWVAPVLLGQVEEPELHED